MTESRWRPALRSEHTRGPDGVRPVFSCSLSGMHSVSVVAHDGAIWAMTGAKRAVRNNAETVPKPYRTYRCGAQPPPGLCGCPCRLCCIDCMSRDWQVEAAQSTHIASRIGLGMNLTSQSESYETKLRWALMHRRRIMSTMNARFDPKAGNWTRMAPVPLARAGGMAMTI